jgi:hypothetical protein
MGSGIKALPFLTSALDGSEWSASRHGRFTPGDTAPGTHLIEGWVDLRAGLNAMEKTQISCPWRESKPGHPARSLITILTNLSRHPFRNLYKLRLITLLPCSGSPSRLGSRCTGRPRQRRAELWLREMTGEIRSAKWFNQGHLSRTKNRNRNKVTGILVVVSLMHVSTILACFQNNKGRLMRSPCCLCVCVSSLQTFSMPQTILMKFGTCIIAPEPISTAYFINPSHQSVCLYVYHHIVARQRLGKHVLAPTQNCWRRLVPPRSSCYVLTHILQHAVPVMLPFLFSPYSLCSGIDAMKQIKM